MKKQLFITFEGIDGCGKTTQIKKTAEYLKNQGIPHILTREPGGTPLAEKIRNLILSPLHKEMSNSCELLLYLASRAQHIEEKIVPALAMGKIVLCDRFQEATFAYQGFGRGYNLDLITKLNSFATNDVQPTRTYILDISIDTAFGRMQRDDKQLDRLENNSRAFFNNIRKGYQSLAKMYPQRMKLVAGENTPDQIFSEISSDLESLLK